MRKGGPKPAVRPPENCDHRSHAPEPPPATGVTSTSSVLPALAPGRIFLFTDQLQTLLKESSALRPPLRLCKTPIGVPSSTVEAGDASHRDELNSKLGLPFPRTAVSKRRAARRLPPRRVRNIRFAHLHPRRRRTEKPLRPTVSVRAPWEIIPDKLTVYRLDFLLRRGARTHRVFYWPAGGKLHCPRAGGTWPNNLRCLAKFLLQQSRAGRAILTS